MKPSLFIGCSAENLEIAYALQECLERDAEVTVWDQGVFAPSMYTLDQLTSILDDTDFGAFIFAPDDIVQLRDFEYQAVRDNVLFELGLSVGALGRERSFVLLPSGMKDFRLPSDLLGMTPALYEGDRRDRNLIAALGPAANKLRKAMVRFGQRNEALQDSTPSQIESTQDAASLPDLPPDVDQQNTPTLTSTDLENLEQIIRSERARAHLWEYRYLNYFLVPATHRVLDWFYNLPQGITAALYHAYWYSLIPQAGEREAILNALEAHFLIDMQTTLLSISPKGREYVEWRGVISPQETSPVPNVTATYATQSAEEAD